MVKWVVALALVLLVPVIAQAGTSHVYLQGGQAEYGSTTPCVQNSSTLSNGQPATVVDCTTTTADTFYVHLVIPQDFNPAVSTQWSILTAVMPEADISPSGRYGCIQYSLTVFPGAANYMTGTIADPATSTAIQAEGVGKWVVTGTNTLVQPFNSYTGATCGTECRGQQAVLKGKRVACSAPYTTDIIGALGIIRIDAYYSN